MFKLSAAQRLMANWWSDLGPEGQERYINDHPNSKKAKEARENGKGNAEEPKDKPAKDQEQPKPGQGPGAPESVKQEQKREQQVDQKPKRKPLAPGKPLSAFAKERDDPHVSAASILSKLKPEDAQEIQDRTREAMRLTPSDAMYMENGQYTRERRALHRKIIKSVLTPERIKAATPEPGTKPTFVVLGGRGGSGKSSFTHNEETGAAPTVNEFDSRKFLTLDADAVKGQLIPPYEGWNANQVHEESSFVFDQIMDMAQKMGLNIISDATLKSDKMGPQLEKMIDDGYEIEGHYMYLPRQKAAERACGRYLKKGPEDRGRLVPPAVILGNTENEGNFDKLKGYFKRWSAYNNDVERGQSPQLIDHSDYAEQKMDYEDDDWENDGPGDRAKKEARVVKAAPNARGPRYTADDWENDPFLRQNPEQLKKAQALSFANMRGLGVKPEQVAEGQREAYVDYLDAAEQRIAARARVRARAAK